MPRFDEGVVNNKLLKGNIILMGNPTQYGEILAQNFFIEDITKANIDTLISNNNLVQGKFYRITDAVSATLSLLVQALTENSLCDYAYNTANGELVTYNISTDLAGVPFSSVYVPYTGATSNVNLGEQGISAGYVGYDLTPTNTPATQGTTYWNANEETLSLIMNGVTQQIGLDTFDNVKNSTGIAIPKGTAVRFAGTDGNTGRLLIAPMLADGTYPSEYYMGVTAEAINNGDFGKVIVFGKLRGINTSAYNNGDILYISSTVAGKFQTTPPTAPNNIIVAATVVSASNNGTLMVRATLGSNINNDEGVKITSPATGQLLQLQSNGLWENKTKAQILGGTSSQFVKGDGSLDNTNYLSTISGISAGGELSGTYPNPSLVTSAVTGKPLTGLSVSGSAVVSTDSILTGIGKLQNQINAVVGSVNFQGVWNASTNSPSLASGVGTKGYYYVVSVPGSTNLDGITDWKLGDWAIYDGTAWQKVDNTDAVVSVNGYTGIVTLAAADVGALPTSAISGTTGKLAKFTSSGAVGDSIVSESGGIMSVAGAMVVNNDLQALKLFHPTNETYMTTQVGSNILNIGLNNSIAFYVSNLTHNFLTNSGATNSMSLSATELITFGATDTGEAHIFGGSARVNGATYLMGSVGINTTSTQGVLQVLGNAINANNGLVITTNTFTFLSSGSFLRFGHTATSGNVVATIENLTAGGTANGALALNAGSGNVLIGTTTDDGVNKLQVSGSVRATGILNLETAAEIRMSNPTNTNRFDIGLLGGSSDAGAYIYQRHNADLYIGTNNTTRLTIASTGAATFSSSVQATTLKLTSLPTSSAGLSTGDVWNDGGTLKIV